jgi:hypothetical protein
MDPIVIVIKKQKELVKVKLNNNRYAGGKYSPEIERVKGKTNTPYIKTRPAGETSDYRVRYFGNSKVAKTIAYIFISIIVLGLMAVAIFVLSRAR